MTYGAGGSLPALWGVHLEYRQTYRKKKVMKIKDSEATVIHADNFAVEYKYRMTLEHEGKTYYWHGFMGEYGQQDYWYDQEEKLIVQPDWVDEIKDSLFDIAEDKIVSDKRKNNRTNCGHEVEEAIIKELLLQGFPLDLTKEVLRTYPIDEIIFEQIMKTASIQIDELQKVDKEDDSDIYTIKEEVK